MSMELAVSVRRQRAIVVLAIAIVAISAAAAWTILEPASAAPPARGVPGYQVVSAANPLIVSPGNTVAVNVPCPSGTKPLGGGASNENDNSSESFAVLTASAPTAADDGWRVRVKNEVPTGTGDITMNAYAVCATA
jgi:hypothetical protein